jgi:cardiolipin synthase C
MIQPFTWRNSVFRSLQGALTLCAICLLVACAGVPEPREFEKPPSHTLVDTADTRLARAIRAAFPDQLQHSGFLPLADGMRAFASRVALIDAAERSLDIQYYIWHPDTAGILLADRLLKAADRGVRVRLLLDDLDTEGKDVVLAQLDAHPGIEVRLFNPFGFRGSRGVGFLGDLKRLNHRMHNKSLTADNQATVVGGRNIGNEYFNGEAQAAFADLDVLGIGPVVGKVSAMFDEYWNSDLAVPVTVFADPATLTRERLQAARARWDQRVDRELASAYVHAVQTENMVRDMRLAQMPFCWGDAVLVYDDPNKLQYAEVSSETHLAPRLAPMFNSATREVLVVSPYFVPGDAMVDFFSGLVARGIDVRILTNSLAANDVGLVHAGYMRYRKDLLRGGVTLYEFKPERALREDERHWRGASQASLHAKTLGADGERVFVGSFNLDPRSIALNTEMGVIIHSPELAQMMHRGFEQLVREQAYRVELVDGDLQWLETPAGDAPRRYDHEPETSWWQRFATTTLSLFVPESML